MLPEQGPYWILNGKNVLLRDVRENVEEVP